jgi:hypothetical protein
MQMRVVVFFVALCGIFLFGNYSAHASVSADYTSYNQYAHLESNKHLKVTHHNKGGNSVLDAEVELDDESLVNHHAENTDSINLVAREYSIPGIWNLDFDLFLVSIRYNKRFNSLQYFSSPSPIYISQRVLRI